MLQFSTFSFPLCFLSAVRGAARYAACLAREFGSQVFFLHVGQPEDANKLEAFVSKEIGATPHKSIVLDGDPATRIIECATEWKADLTVVPHLSRAISRIPHRLRYRKGPSRCRMPGAHGRTQLQ